MKKLIVAAALCGSILASASAAFGAEIEDGRTAGTARLGAFAGARLRVPLGGGGERPKAGLAFTNVRLDGSGARHFSKGIEAGFMGDDQLQVSIAGRRLDRLGIQAAGRTAEGRKLGISTIGWVAIGTGVAIVVGAALFVDAVRDSSD